MGRIKGKLCPNAWKSGTDPVEHKKYRVFIQQRNQAQFRDEGWNLSFEVWKDLWKDLWPKRGRCAEDYCMSRIDWSLPWTLDNVDIINRVEHHKRQRVMRAMGWRSIAQKRRLAKRNP